MVESFAYAPWVVLFSLLVFIIFYGGCILGQQIMKLSETGKDSLILFSTERTYRSWSDTWDYVLLFTRFVSFAYLLSVPIIYGSITNINMYSLWYSFRIWNCLLVELFFVFNLANSCMGLFLPEGRSDCQIPTCFHLYHIHFPYLSRRSTTLYNLTYISQPNLSLLYHSLSVLPVFQFK